METVCLYASLQIFSNYLDITLPIEWRNCFLHLFTCLIGNFIVWTRNAVIATDDPTLLSGFPESWPAAGIAHRLRNLKIKRCFNIHRVWSKASVVCF